MRPFHWSGPRMAVEGFEQIGAVRMAEFHVLEEVRGIPVDTDATVAWRLGSWFWVTPLSRGWRAASRSWSR